MTDDPWVQPEQQPQEKPIHFSYKRTDRVVMASIPPHGQFCMYTDDVNQLIRKYHSYSMQEMRNKLASYCEDNGMYRDNYKNLTRFECYMVLGEFEGHGL